MQFDHFTFIWCMEKFFLQKKHFRNKEAVWKYCSETLKLDPKPIKDCYDSGEGRKLELGYANESTRLIPPKRYVPWVVVNKKHIDEGYLEATICREYKGENAPKVCKSMSPKKNSDEKANPKHSVCYANEISLASEAPGGGKGAWMHQEKKKP